MLTERGDDMATPKYIKVHGEVYVRADDSVLPAPVYGPAQKVYDDFDGGRYFDGRLTVLQDAKSLVINIPHPPKSDHFLDLFDVLFNGTYGKVLSSERTSQYSLVVRFE